MMDFKFIDVLDYNIYADKNLPEIDCSTCYRFVINTINAYSYVIAKKDNEFKRSLLGSDILLPDGFPIIFAAKFLKKGRVIRKIAGEDIFYHLMEYANQKGLKVMFVGASEKVLSIIELKTSELFSKIDIKTYSPPYSKYFSASENFEIINAINDFSPNILFVGMTAPKQEKWVHENKFEMNANVICSIGAVFDFYAGTIKRPGKLWISLRLEWFIRLLKEPKRLWKRYLIYSPLFFIDVLKAKINGNSMA